MVSSEEILRRKAMLLLRREREVFELRYERGRTEVWLGAFHKLSSNLHSSAPASLIDDWVSSMVYELTFQVASVHAYEPSTRTLRLISSLAPREMPSDVRIDAALAEHLEREAGGQYGMRKPEILEALGQALDLGMFYWLFLPNRGENLLLTAGFVSGTETFRCLSPQDLPHFVQLGKHLVALLDNSRLIAELRETRDKLVQSSKLLAEVSRRAGMADVATGILHNVGNALNSVNVSVEIVGDKLQALDLSGLGRIAALLGDERELKQLLASEERAQKLPAYVDELGSHLGSERDGMLAEVLALRKHLEHIKAIVGKQQTHAMPFDVAQSCSVAELVSEALNLSAHWLEQLGIEVICAFAEVPAIVTDRHKVLQILVNLISNARAALTSPECSLRKLELTVSVLEPDASIAITVRDTGAGIASENLEKLFRYGYTTKRDGHGFGLHTSAIAARELGGKLSAHSDGAGRGASFVLELPLDMPRAG